MFDKKVDCKKFFDENDIISARKSFAPNAEISTISAHTKDVVNSAGQEVETKMKVVLRARGISNKKPPVRKEIHINYAYSSATVIKTKDGKFISLITGHHFGA